MLDTSRKYLVTSIQQTRIKNNNKRKLKALGKQIFIDLYHCNTALINDVAYIKKSMEVAAQKAHATIINSTFHHFSPHGVSGVVVIQESHLAIHTWPEHGFSAIDIFTCGDTIDAQVAYEYLKSALQATHSTTSEMQRGLYPSNSGEHL